MYDWAKKLSLTILFLLYFFSSPLSAAHILDSYINFFLKNSSYQSKKPAFPCPWFPKEELTQGGDPVNNLYHENGCLKKHDWAMQTNTQEYEWEHNRLPHNNREHIIYGQ